MMPPSEERVKADRLVLRQLSGSIIMPLAEDIWERIMKIVRIVKSLYPSWLRRKYSAIWDFRDTERILFGIRLPLPEPEFYGPGMEIGAYTGLGRPKILKFLMS